MYAAFPRSKYYKRGPTSTVAFVSLRFGHSVDILSPLQPNQDGGGSPRCHDASISDHAVLSDPAGVSSDHRLWRSPTVAFQIFDPVGPRICHEAQSLHLRYGLAIALSTLNPCRYLHEPKTRFPVGRLFPFPGRELHPLKAPGLSWRTEKGIQISMDGKGRWADNVFVERLWRSLKYEHVYLHAYESVGEARRKIGSYFEFYNSRRPHSSLGAQTPDQVYFHRPPETLAA